MSEFSRAPFSCQTQSLAHRAPQHAAPSHPRAHAEHLLGSRPGWLHSGVSSTQRDLLLQPSLYFPEKVELLKLCSQPSHPDLGSGAAPRRADGLRASSSHKGWWPSTHLVNPQVGTCCLHLQVKAGRIPMLGGGCCSLS